MTFTELCWQETKSIYDAIVEHPFNRELARGTLSADRFAHYVQQDSHYLRDYARCLALLAAKASSSGIAEDLLNYAKEGIAVERALHGHFFAQFQIGPAEEQAPACFAYTQFLLAAVGMESFSIGLAAVLPCFWIYREVGLHIAAHAATPNPYAPWIDTYSDESFGTAVARMLEITNSEAAAASEEVRRAMRRAFVVSSRCEWLFWDGAYRLEQWPI